MVYRQVDWVGNANYQAPPYVDSIDQLEACKNVLILEASYSLIQSCKLQGPGVR